MLVSMHAKCFLMIQNGQIPVRLAGRIITGSYGQAYKPISFASLFERWSSAGYDPDPSTKAEAFKHLSLYSMPMMTVRKNTIFYVKTTEEFAKSWHIYCSYIFRVERRPAMAKPKKGKEAQKV